MWPLVELMSPKAKRLPLRSVSDRIGNSVWVMKRE